MPPDNDARSLYRYVGSLTRPVTHRVETVKFLVALQTDTPIPSPARAAMPPDYDARGLYQYAGSLTRPVTHIEETVRF